MAIPIFQDFATIPLSPLCRFLPETAFFWEQGPFGSSPFLWIAQKSWPTWIL